MTINTKKISSGNQEINNYRWSAKYVALGFIAILGLFVFILVIWSNTAARHTHNLKLLGEHQLQARLLANMLYAVQKRSLHLHQMLEKSDPFALDDEYIQFRQAAEMYLKNREKLLATPLSKNEREILAEADKLANYGGFAQERVAHMIKQGDSFTARPILFNKITPNQNALIDKLRSIFESQRNIVENELDSATREHDNTYWLIFFLGGAALLLGIFTIFVVKRTAQSETKLFDQSKWIRSLYEISSISGLTPDEQISETLKFGCELLEMEIGKVCQVDLTRQTNNFLHVAAPGEYSIKAGLEIPLNKTFCSLTIDAKEPVAIPHVQESNYASYPCYEFSHIESYLAMPLYVTQQKFGTVNFSSMNPRQPFSKDDIDLLKLITNSVSVTIERKISQQIAVAKETAEAANRTKSSFLANMSHELRTPLNAILGYNEMLVEEITADGNTQYLPDLEKMELASKHLLSLISDILDLSKIEAGKMDIYLEHFALKPLIDEIHATILPLIDKNNNNFQLVYDDNISVIKNDLTKVRQILFNLLSNACKFTEDGIIKLAVSAERNENNNRVKFVVKDTGIGMDREQLNKLFTSFYQAEPSTRSKYGGTGLGLAISYRLCKLLGGSIDVDSVPGVGSTFTITLPVTIAEETSGTMDARAATG